MSSEKYFIAIIPPQAIVDYIDNYRRQYNKDCLTSVPPHITVYPPFYLSNPESELIDKLNKIQVQISPFRVSFTSFDFFSCGNNVAYLKPDSESTIQLRNLYKITRSLISGEIIDVWPNYPINLDQYSPHCTIAEQISDNEFSKVRHDLEPLSVNQGFDVNSIFLLNKHQGKWSTVLELNFNTPDTH